MEFQKLETLSTRLAQWMLESSRRSSLAHAQFLRQRAAALGQMEGLLARQVRESFPAAPGQTTGSRPALYGRRQLEAFGTGRISGCFGPAYAHYDERRIPRIPNGDLLMMSRVVEIRGSLGGLDQPAEVVVEYDAPPDAWYFRGGSGELPYSLLMETALQPCGFLSAWLDTYALVPHEHYYFRNLDGSAQVVGAVDLSGKTLSTRARLLSSAASGGTVIQKFVFSVSAGDKEIYHGESTFGYFSAESMANQVGLDGGKPLPPWIRRHPGGGERVVDLQSWRAPAAWQNPCLPAGRLAFLDQVLLSPVGGKHGKGYVYAARPVDPRDWFYPFHFHGDPVMPGSLGVEAVLEALKAFTLAQGWSSGEQPSCFALPVGGPPSTWRYRGQITPRHSLMELEVHLSAVERRGRDLALAGDASVWVDGLRIYEIKNAAVHIHEGSGVEK